jgi:hypothetical protein
MFNNTVMNGGKAPLINRHGCFQICSGFIGHSKVKIKAIPITGHG